MNDQVPIVLLTSVPETLMFFEGQPAFLRDRGFDVHVVSSPGAALDAFAESEEVKVRAVEMPRRLSPWPDLLALIRLAALFRALRPRIVHAHTPKAGILGVFAAWLAGVPVRIFHIHGLPHLTAGGVQRFLVAWTTKLCCLLATRVLAVSASNREVALADAFCPAAKIRVPAKGSIGGVDALRKFNPGLCSPQIRRRFRERYGIPPDSFVAAYVGRLAGDKGLRELAQAWEAVRRDAPHAVLLVVGEADARDPLPAAVQSRLFSQPGVIRTGWLGDTPSLYKAVDLVVLPTYREGFPVVLLEAAAMSVPVVSTNATGCRDAVIDGETGTTVPVHDAVRLAEAVLQYVADPSLGLRHGRAARARALADFRPETVWQAIMHEYRCELAIAGAGRPHPANRLKRILDLTAAGMAIVLLAPLMAVIAAAIRLTIDEPAIFTQARSGLRDREFRVFKFRTMRTLRGPHGELLPDGVRLTKLGSWLRKVSLDELPQLWNVVLGDMSLVGPRPLLPRYLPRYTPRQRRRHEVRPGITGWAQINGRNELLWEEKFELDVWYVEHQSLWLDLKILALTVKQVLKPAGISHPGVPTMPEFMGAHSAPGRSPAGLSEI